MLYLSNSDGSDVQKIDLPDKGYVIDPAWSPNGQLVAFSWRRPNGNYDIYAMDIVSHQLVELTRDAGRNERPSWAPDGRHLVFESTRTGHAADLVHAGRWEPAASVNLSGTKRITELVSEVRKQVASWFWRRAANQDSWLGDSAFRSPAEAPLSQSNFRFIAVFGDVPRFNHGRKSSCSTTLL